MTINPSYNITQQTRNQEDQYDNISALDNEFALQGMIQDTMMDFIPTFGRVQSSKAAIAYVVPDDSTIKSNPLSSSSTITSIKETTMMPEDEDEDGYVKTTQPTGYLKIIGPTTEKEDSL